MLHRKIYPLQFLAVTGAVLVFEAIVISTHQYSLAEIFAYWWLFPISFAIALIVNTVGVSGASLFVPFFILIFPLLAGFTLTPLDAVTLGLVTESFGLSSSAIAFILFGLVDKKLVWQSLVAALPFVVIGVLFVSVVPSAVLKVAIAALLFIAVILLRYSHRLEQKRIEECRKGIRNITEASGIDREKLVHKIDVSGNTYEYYLSSKGRLKRTAGYAIGGIFQGATGFGIGELGLVSMFLSRIPIKVAIGTSHVIVAVSAITAALIHFSLSTSTGGGLAQFPWVIPLMTVPAVVIGGQIAPYLAARLSGPLLEKAISALFVVIGIALMLVAVYS